MAKARMYGMTRKGIPNKRCLDRHWKHERNGKNGTKQNKYSQNGKQRNGTKNGEEGGGVSVGVGRLFGRVREYSHPMAAKTA